MDGETALYIAAGIIAGALGYYAWTRSDLFGGLAVLFALGWLTVRFIGWEAAWNTFGSLTDPPRAAVFVLIVGTAYYALRGNPLPGNLVFGIGLAFLGGVLGMMLFKLWNPA